MILSDCSSFLLLSNLDNQEEEATNKVERGSAQGLDMMLAMLNITLKCIATDFPNDKVLFSVLRDFSQGVLLSDQLHGHSDQELKKKFGGGGAPEIKISGIPCSRKTRGPHVKVTLRRFILNQYMDLQSVLVALLHRHYPHRV